ncbi:MULTISPECIES: FUSC family membrane protein [unclassified Janthinobacterium]|uniref:FUSC family protein n=1 Tax=unclassified Janthinobacterium TaxID=2610881 RepID=UPI00161A11DC|nr:MULTISPECIES: FUSC family membrane protein [unclassified Janthinobacterium]MBB5371198.1 putative membrane protein YccC [Janthinobacterium sp. K2C7]MBB5384004.1 putative membrane protein YccC [Janthinobacterium sp. K2Li3]MBB5389174.1 putative membrane protein YccC [Janthinobacterium sp. K2E3]
MHYALNLRTFIYSHYFYLGLRVAFGLVGLTLLTLAISDSDTAMTVCIGALCTTLMDMPSPLRHKFNEMLSSVLLCSAVTLLISLCAQVPWLLMAVLVIVSFFASMMVVYGKKSMPLQLAALFIMTMSMEHHMTWQQALHHAGLFMLGGLAYLAYAMGVAWFLRHRIKQQVLAEALFELAAYIDIKADFYDTRFNLTEQFNKLVRHQSILADRQQASRDLILRSHKNSKDAIVVQVHVCMLDLYELILSTHTDYALLRQHLADSDVLKSLHDLAYKAARDIESVAYAVTRKRASYAQIQYEQEWAEIEAEIARLQARGESAQEALATLRAQRNKIRALLKMIAELHVASQKVSEHVPFWRGADMAPFLSQPKYELTTLFASMRMESPVFRFALRVSMAICAGLAIAHWLPYAAHSYWIVLTIVIILRPTFSMTRQRRADRIIGTLIGCVLTALVIRFVHSDIVLMAILFLAVIAMPTFIYLRYRYTAIAVSLMILLQLHLVAPSNPHLVTERLIDTFIGAVVATIFSFVLASWEYQSLPRLVRQVLNVNLAYMQASFELLQGKTFDDIAYRIERKRLMDSLAALSSALVRMLDEPASKQRAVEDINLFIVQNYLLVAHVAALRSILGRHAHELPGTQVNALLTHSHTQVCATLSRALEQLDQQASISTPLASQPAPVSADGTWSGWPLVQRRIRLLQADADKIVIHSAAIVHITSSR